MPQDRNHLLDFVDIVERASEFMIALSTLLITSKRFRPTTISTYSSIVMSASRSSEDYFLSVDTWCSQRGQYLPSRSDKLGEDHGASSLAPLGPTASPCSPLDDIFSSFNLDGFASNQGVRDLPMRGV